MNTKTLTDEELAKLKKEIRECLANDRHTLLIKFPFAGNILMRMDLIPVRDVRCLTACTDGNHVYFNIAFYESLAKEERVFVLAHEVWHAIMLHLVRCQSRDPELFNIATDMEVNYMLSQQNNGTLFTPPKGLLFPPKSMQGKSAEVIYEWLLRKQQKNKQNQKSNSNGSGASMPSSGKSRTRQSGRYSIGNSQDDDNDGNCDTSKDGKKSGKLEGQFDTHSYDDDTIQDQKEGKGTGIIDKYGEVGFDKDFNPHVSGDFAEKMREAVIAEVQRTQRMQGTLPAGIDGMLDQICKPEHNWKEELCNFVTSCYNGSRRWLPPSRRHVYNEIYMQSRRSERLNVAVCIDTSGSCLGDLPKFFGELKGLLDSFGSYDLHLMNCDAEVDYYEHFDDSNPLTISKASDVKWSGGGGTSFKPPFKYVRENNIQPDCFVYFTDAYGDAPMNPPPYPVLWVLTKDGNKDFCDWGKKIYFKSSTSESYTSLSS